VSVPTPLRPSLATRRGPAPRPRRGRCGPAAGASGGAAAGTGLRVAACAAAVLAAACEGPAPGAGRRVAVAGEPAAAEFLLVAGDSTYWVTSDARGVRVRGAPLFLARIEGRLHEVYTADEDRSFAGAVFTAQRLYRRDLVTGDSVPLWEDPRPDRLAAAWAAAHPDDRPLDADEEAEAEPERAATAEVALRDVHGAYLSVERHFDHERRGAAMTHELRYAVVDLRTGRDASLADLFGADAARVLARAGAARFAAARDSLRRAADAGALAAALGDDRQAATDARTALRRLRFDATSFGLGVAAGAPAVIFVARGDDGRGGDAVWALPPVAVPGPPPGWWLRDVRPTLPSWTADSSALGWHPPATGGAARRTGWGLRGTVAGGRATLAVAGRVVGAFPAPLHAVHALDQPPLDPTARRALRRAFDESAFYDAATTSVAWQHRP